MTDVTAQSRANADLPAGGAPVRCPVCAASITALAVNRFTSSEAANHFCPPARDVELNHAFKQVIENLWKQDFVLIHTCQQCTHGFAWPYVGGDERFYELMHAHAGYPKMRWEYGAFVHSMQPSASGGRHLDIGTGDGSFLNLLPGTWEKAGTESTDVLRAVLHAKGITTFVNTDDAIARAGHSFDSVTMFQVIEHIADFRQMLESIRQLLKPGGRVGLSVPSGGFKSTQERLTKCADMPPNHVNRWTPQSLKLALEQAGFSSIEVVMQPVSARGLLQQASLKTLGVAVNEPRSLTAQVYRIKSRRLRRGLFSVVGAFHLLTLLPSARAILQPQEFLCIARAP